MSMYPDMLKIGAHFVSLKFQSTWEGDEGSYGEWKELENTIYIREGLSESLTFATLVHEAMHVMNSTMNHEFLDSLAEQMAQFLVDNELVSTVR